MREILKRKLINVVCPKGQHQCTSVKRSVGEPTRNIAVLVSRPVEGIVAWAQLRQADCFLEALGGLFKGARRRARGVTRTSKFRNAIYLIAGTLEFHVTGSNAFRPSWNLTEPNRPRTLIIVEQ